MLQTITRVGTSNKLFRDLAIGVVRKRFASRIYPRRRSDILGYIAAHSGKRVDRNVPFLCNTSIVQFSSNNNSSFSSEQELTSVQFEKISDETLESLTDYFDEIVEQAGHLPDADVSFGDGVLTVKFGDVYGTYVINRQTPNKQIWLSSPKSGPKRYDFINGKWIYKHDGKTMHELLNDEIPAIVKNQANFDKCSFSGKEKKIITDNL